MRLRIFDGFVRRGNGRHHDGPLSKASGGDCGDPERRILELALLSDTEREQLRTVWNDTGTNYPMERRLDDLFAEQAAKTPDAPALIYRGREMSYRELDQRAIQLAHHLVALDVGPDVLVGVCLERSPDLVVAILAVLKAGGAYVPLDPKYPMQRLAFMLEDSAAPVLITHSALRRLLPYTGSVVELRHGPGYRRRATADRTRYQRDRQKSRVRHLHLGLHGPSEGTMLRHSAGYLVDWARRTFSREELRACRRCYLDLLRPFRVRVFRPALHRRSSHFSRGSP